MPNCAQFSGIDVSRSRFLPVKCTNDLIKLMSDLYNFDEENGALTLQSNTPFILDLDTRYFSKVQFTFLL